MDAREERGRVIAETCKIVRWRLLFKQKFYVPSSSRDGQRYTVELGENPKCTCPDYEAREMKCKHIYAVEHFIRQEKNADGSTTVTETVTVSQTVRKTYPQDWPKYNAAQQAEKNLFLSLLADLCAGVPQPERKPTRGTRPVRLSDAVFAAVYKVYSGFSARRFTCDLEEAAEAGHVGRALHFNTVLRTLECEEVTPVLSDLVTKSASPFREVETEWAVDSTGFSGCRFDRWFDEKWGTPRKYGAWVKAHVICGTRTNVIAAAVVGDVSTADSPQLPPLVNAAAAAGFTIKEVAADKAYPGRDNFDAVDKVGGVLYAAFKANSTGAAGGVFGKMYHYFAMNREEWAAHYHRRSMVESTFSMVKRKFGESVRAKTDTAMKNEALAKFVAHNICCVIAAVYERGLAPVFGLRADGDGPRSVIRFPGRG